MTMLKKRHTQAALLALLAVLFASCASTQGKKPPRPDGNLYYESNIHDFSSATLKNAIPVTFKQQQGKTAWVGIVISGGSVLVPKEKGGLEDITLSLMLHGSKAYPYNEMQRLEYEKNFSLSAAAGREYAVVSARFILRDLNEVMALLSDSVLNPLLGEEDFATIITDERAGIQNTLSNPSGVLGLELTKAAFAGHPYASPASVTAETIDAITLEDVRAHHAALLDAARFSVVAVGNFSAKEQKQLVAALNATLGALSAVTGENAFKRPEVPALTVAAGAETVYASCEAAGDTGYISGVFACPDRTGDQYVPFAIALMYIDDLLFAQVREEHGAVYSAGTGVLGGRELLGALSLYKATEKKELQRYVLDAIESFPSEAEIETTLDRYKNKYITSLFSSSQTSGGVASNIVRSLAYYGSPSQYLHRAEQVQAVTAHDVALAYSTYLARSSERALNGKVPPMQWIVVSGKDAVHEFVFK